MVTADDQIVRNICNSFLVEHHLYEISGRTILVDVRKLRYFEITDSACTKLIEIIERKAQSNGAEQVVLELLRNKSSKRFQKALHTLKENGLITTAESTPQQYPGPAKHDLSLYSLVFNISHVCNFTCSYCFAGEKLYDGSNKLMTEKVADAAIEYFLANSSPDVSLGFELFGGEPLLNLPIIKHIAGRVRALDKDRRLPSSIAMPTNGLLLTGPVLDFCLEAGIVVQVSIDGPMIIQNKNRRLHSGEASYSQIIHSIKHYIQTQRLDSSLHATIAPGNVQIMDTVKHLSDDLGANYMAIIEAGGFGKNHCKSDDIEAIKDQWLDMANEYIHRARNGMVWKIFPLETQIRDSVMPKPKFAACGAGKGYLTVTPDGNLFPCPWFSSRPEYLLGNIYDGISHPEIREQFYNNHVDSKDECRKCWARYFCGGRCVALPVEYSGTIKHHPKLFCDLYRRQFEIALYVNTVLSSENIVLDQINKCYISRKTNKKKGDYCETKAH